jgi:hypothetical protein
MMKKKVGMLSFNDGTGNFDILIDDIVSSKICKGEDIEIWINGRWLKDRLEYIDDWCLLFNQLEGNELEGLKVRI